MHALRKVRSPALELVIVVAMFIGLRSSARGVALTCCAAFGALAGCADEPAQPRALPGEGASAVAERSSAARREAPQIPAGSPKVLFLGDSIAAGLHLTPDDAFPAATQRQLFAQGRPFELINAGVSGDTSAGGLRRLDWVLQTRPDVLVVELGANDGLRAGPLGELEANLRAIVRGAKARGVEVVLLGMNITPNLGVEYARGFEQLYERVALEEGATFVPSFLAGVGGEPRMNLEDGLHPTPAGHERLGQNLAPHLARVLEALAR